MVNSFLLALTLTAISLCIGFIIFLYKHDKQDKNEKRKEKKTNLSV
jgi:predicted membrane protein